jgi:hypothetical protein
MNVLDYVKPGVAVVRGYAERLVKQIPEEKFARFPVVNGRSLAINHPAFVLGHLALYPIQLAEMADLPKEGMEIPSSYPDLFKMGVECVDDPAGSLYPKKDELIERYLGSYDALMKVLPAINPEALNRALENPARRERFGTVGAFLVYLLLAHPQSHLGQISAWRRCVGFGPA